MADITYEKLLGTVVVILVLVGVYNTVISAIKNHREEKRIRESPIVQLTTRLDRHDELLAKDKVRIDKLEEQGDDLDQQSRIMMRSMKALLSHEINGNSSDKLRDAMSEIDDFLISR